MNWINPRLAGNLLISFFALFSIFHILVIAEFVPSDIVWGGKFQEANTSLVLVESAAIVVTLLFALMISIKLNYFNIARKTANIGVWIIVVFFILNTVGNLASDVLLEKLIFTPITIIFACLSFRIAILKNN